MASSTAVALRAHASLGASNAAQWMRCPGSVRAQAPLPNADSPAALEGTAAHELIELAFRTKQPARKYLGHEFVIPTMDGGTCAITIDDDMVEATQIFLDRMEHHRVHAAAVYSEEPFSLAALRPPVEMFGTSDFAAVYPAEQLLVIEDYKHGRGVIVDAEDNEQVRYYAVGFLLRLQQLMPSIAKSIRKVRLVIVQPRVTDAEGEPRITEQTISFAELKQWVQRELLPAARRTLEADAPRIPGDKQCHFCRYTSCPERADLALKAVQMEFADLGVAEPTLPTPEEMTPLQIQTLLELESLFMGFYKAVKNHARNGIASGTLVVPGFALKKVQKHRVWKDPLAAEKQLTKAGLKFNAIMTTPKLLSPAKVEAACKKAGVEYPVALVMVPETDEVNLCSMNDKNALPQGNLLFPPVALGDD